jgi:hypothetical protein
MSNSISCALCVSSVVLMRRKTSSLQLLAPLLLTGGKGADLVIRGNVVLNTLSARSTSTLLRDWICINSSSRRQVPRPCRTVLRDRFHFRSASRNMVYNFLIESACQRTDLVDPVFSGVRFFILFPIIFC